MKTVALGLILGGGYYLWLYNRARSRNLKPHCCEESTILSNNPYLPEEIIFNILSYMPIKSLLRFKCVCKYWNAITLDPQFIYLHYSRSPYVFYKKTHISGGGGGNKDDYVLINSRAGLTLERSRAFSPRIKFRVRNLALHQVLELPNPQNRCLNMDFHIFPSKQIFKVVSVHRGENKVLGYEVLDLILGINNENTTNCYSWRPLVVPPNLHNSGPTGNRLIFLFVLEVAYCIWDVQTPERIYTHIDILEMKNERYIGNTICPVGFPSNLSSNNYCVVNWDGKLSLVETVKDELHVLVLDDYKAQRWAESKVIINLTCLKREVKETQLMKLGLARGSKLIFDIRFGGNFSCGLFDCKTKRLTILPTNCDRAEFFAVIRPSLLTVKGMQSHSSTQTMTQNPYCVDYFDMSLVLSSLFAIG